MILNTLMKQKIIDNKIISMKNILLLTIITLFVDIEYFCLTNLKINKHIYY